MDDLKSELYKRQHELKLKIPYSVAIIGLGGVGSWVAWGFGLSGVQQITLIDHDTVEESNLNRTPYRKRDIGMPKVEGMADILIERRTMTISPIAERVENIPLSYFKEIELVVDCRDVSTPLHPEIQSKVRIIGGYNGNSITMHLNPNPKSIWGGGGGGYTVIPSSLLPCWAIGLIIIDYILCCPPRKKEYIKTFNISTLIKRILELPKEKAPKPVAIKPVKADDADTGESTLASKDVREDDLYYQELEEDAMNKEDKEAVDA